MRILSLLIILIVCTCCEQKQPKLVDSPITLDKKQVAPKAEQHAVTVNSLKQKKFNRPIEFSKFQVDTFSGKKSTINYKSHLLARQFRTIITETYKNEGLNFGGHYTIATWGCGTSCQDGAMVDLQTGSVYPVPTAASGYNYKKSSLLLVANPPDSSGFYDDCSYCAPELWVWAEGQKKFKRLH